MSDNENNEDNDKVDHMRSSQNNRTKASRRKASQTNSFKKRLAAFRKSVQDGCIHPCYCCHRKLYSNGVKPFQVSNFEETGVIKYIDLNSTVVEPKYICYTCFNYMKKKRMPPMCVKNGLMITHLLNDDGS